MNKLDLTDLLERMKARKFEPEPEPVVEPCSCDGLGYTWATGVEWKALPCSCVSSCSCDDGWVYTTDDRGYDYAGKCGVCGPKLETITLLNSARLPGKHNPSNVKPTKAQRKMFRFLKAWLKQYEPSGPGFVLRGPVGTGKTHALVAVCRGLAVEKKERVRFVHVPAMLIEIKMAIEEGRASAAQMHEYCTLPVLALDEVAELRTEWEQRTLSDVLLTRYQAGLTTIGTTNLPEEHMYRAFGHDAGRVVSRLHEVAPFVEVAGDDMRRGKGKS